MQWSPDGSQISYGEWVDTDNNALTTQTHVVRADGTDDIVLPTPAGATWQSPESWSNDSSRLVVLRGHGDRNQGARPAVIPVDGSGDTGIEIDVPYAAMSPNDPWFWEWAPDDSSILVTPADDGGNALEQVLLDPVAGTYRTLPWSSISLPSWQRMAP